MPANPGKDDSAPSARQDGRALDLGAWREQAVAGPFDDPKVRRRIAELIIDAAAKPEDK